MRTVKVEIYEVREGTGGPYEQLLHAALIPVPVLDPRSPIRVRVQQLPESADVPPLVAEAYEV